jgi:hypothetical protein
MNEQFKYVIKKTINRINSGEVTFGLIGLSEKELTPEPRFYKTEDKKLKCYQHNLLGFYVLRSAYRGILLSINYLLAADFNLSKKLSGPAVSNYYTCAYHILGAYLALNGRIVFDNLNLFDNKKIINVDKFAIASFTKGNWHIESKKWGHAGKWQEIKQLRLDEYPNSLIHLFKYWFKFRIKEDISMNEYVRRLVNKETLGTPLSIKDIPDEFLKRISQTRHQAIYGSLGSEPEVMSNLVNKDAFNDNGIDYQALAFKNFCYGFINENVDSLIELLNFIRILKKTRSWLSSAIFQPWFDEPQISQIKDSQLQQKLQQIELLLFSKRQKHIPPIEVLC